jgi:hypothetical protein
MGESFYRAHAAEYGLDSSLLPGRSTGEVELAVRQTQEQVHIRLHAGHPWEWLSGKEGVNTFVRGYGATRLLPRRAPSSEWPLAATPELKNVDNLFDPYAPLTDPTRWLNALDDRDLAEVCLSLRDLLEVKHGDGRLDFLEPRRPGKLARFGLVKGRHGIPLEQFSTGYQTLLLLACDIMAGLGTGLQDMRKAPGILLVDEIGSNLHPRWRMRILGALERTFPGMQLIASTHEPLCILGLGKGEVAVLNKRKGKVEVHDDLPSPAGMRVDQLLTSEFFGLHTTMDPRLENAFELYYHLLVHEASLNASDKERLKQLERELRPHSVLGHTRRDQFILRGVDGYLATQAEAKKKGPAEAKKKGPAKEVVDLMKEAMQRLTTGHL